MPYSELVKNFEIIRGFMRQFYVYGFKQRSEYRELSPRSYDNERRRMESWLGDYMAFRRNENGKTVFLSVDSRAIAHNPLFTAFKAKSFTDKDIFLHFCLLDALSEKPMTAGELAETLSAEYLSGFDSPMELDLSTVRKKLQEYETLGLLQGKKEKNRLYYSVNPQQIELLPWKAALDFFSESAPLGVLGSTLLDKLPQAESVFRLKHHYILAALDSDILCDILLAMNEHRQLTIVSKSLRSGIEWEHTVLPMQIFSSTQTGRVHLLTYHYRYRRPMFFRVDSIVSVKAGETEPDWETYQGYLANLKKVLWGVSLGDGSGLEHLEMTVFVDDREQFIVNRLDREKRCGKVEQVDEHHYRYCADVLDSSELLPWLRTFIGRITALSCSNKDVESTFFADLRAMAKRYGGDENAV